MAERAPNLDRAVTVVSGMPRAGTSMLMQMLEAAGLEIHFDDARPADSDNPRGYYELAATKRLPKDASYLECARGKVVKVVAPLLASLPARFQYRVIFVERDMGEIMASQRAMMERNGQAPVSDAAEQALTCAFQKGVEAAKRWLDDSANVHVCYVMHADVVDSAMKASLGILDFLEAAGDVSARPWSNSERQRILSRMAGVVNRDLYRQRRRSN